MLPVAPVLNHLWQSTVVAAVIALVTLAFRRDRAQIRHALWLAASIKCLLPFAVLRWIGLQLPAPTWPSPADAVPIGLQVIASPFSRIEFTAFPHAIETAAVVPDLAPHVPRLLLALWIVGAMVVAASWANGWRALRRITRNAAHPTTSREAVLLRRLEQQSGARRALPLAIVDSPIEPGVFGVAAPVLLWPAAIGDRLSDAQVEAILAHELAHVRRRDTLTAALHTVVQVVFWFYPMVWWIGAHLLAEREQACDEDVLRRGSDPQVYAESILRLCECLLEDQQACAAAATGADLTRRIERIMTPHRASLGRPAQAMLTVLGVAAVAMPVMAGTLVPGGIGYGGAVFQVPRLTTAFAPRAHVDPAAAARARFASAHVRRAGASEAPGLIRPLAGGRLTARSVTVAQLVVYAYGDDRMPPTRIVGLPDWTRTERYTITARAARPFVNDESGEPRELILMLRRLLADRFGIETHEEPRRAPVYALVRAAAGPGPGLAPTASTCWRPPDGPPPPGVLPNMSQVCRTTWNRQRDVFIAEGLSMRAFARMLGRMPGIDQPVVDDTRLGGSFDVSLAWGPSSADPSSPDALPTALTRQLGLALDPRIVTAGVLVIDRAERPATD